MVVALYLRRVRRLWWVLIAAVVLGLGLSVLGYQSQTPRYVAITQLAIGHSGTTAGDEFEAHNLILFRAQALAGVADKAPVIQKAMERAGVTGSLPQVVTNSGDSSLVAIAVVDTDPVRAAKVANGLAAVLPAELAHLVGPLDTGLTLHVTLPAVPPSAPYSPVKKRWLELGLALGLALGLGIIAAIDVLDRSLRDGDQLVAVTGRPLLAVIPRRVRLPLPTRGPRPSRRQAEGHRSLRAAVVASGAKVVAVTSTTAGEGRTSVVTHLGAALHASGRRVLIVEADLRRPTLASHYGLSGDVGLSQALHRHLPVRTVIQDAGVGPKVLVAGRAEREDSDLFGDTRFADLLADLGAEVDLILIDAPHIERNASAEVVCAAADATIVVARIGRVTPARLRSAMEMLSRSGTVVLGVVANASRGGSAADAALRTPLARVRRRWRRG
ncbi:capsular exopolysaccharide biosynthesis protein [Nocardioides baekrokdamisoli]|uniref:Capsular exopolysaccharide biosynthesis protein n=1 Tax=Nocardioides baekrokdamisoli TaxID=1804624 RepID=A0A3G9IFG2_9ACTN|nr:capsular exopolysaccharide biosynthesis protein [Nocardioides baekrokdamisoli]